MGVNASFPPVVANRAAFTDDAAMKIATFNINGVKARIPALTDWLGGSGADLVVLQEIKSVDEGFPRQHFEDLGWTVETHGQKGFNGVAILSRLPLEDVTRGLPGDEAVIAPVWQAAERRRRARLGRALAAHRRAGPDARRRAEARLGQRDQPPAEGRQAGRHGHRPRAGTARRPAGSRGRVRRAPRLTCCFSKSVGSFRVI